MANPKELDIKLATQPINNTMLKYFKKLPSKSSLEEPLNQTTGTYFLINRQHVENFRVDEFDRQAKFIGVPTSDGSSQNYLSAINHGCYKPFKINKRRGYMRAKLLQFNEDVRPPYYGTWRKRSRLVSGRRPFGCDTNVFDYDCDSEAEWDIGGPGESLKDSEEEDDHHDDYEIDMKTFVPHGYVSDDEVDIESGELTTMNGGTHRRQQQLNQQAEQKVNMKPNVLGICFDSLGVLKEFEGVSCTISL